MPSDKNMTTEYKDAVSKLLHKGAKFNKDKVTAFMEEHCIKPRDVTAPAEQLGKVIKNSTGKQIQDKIMNKEFDLQSVVRACQYVIQNECKTHNAIMFMLYEHALARAKQLDEEIQKSSKEEMLQRRPLVGYMLSLKDVFAMANTPTTCGLFCNLDRMPNMNGPMVDTLLSKGALVISKGSVAQMLFSMETSNNLVGPCSAPNSNFQNNSGGSSGGCACTVALGGANAAIGSDVAGSLRIPALFCGVMAFKPTDRRVSASSHLRFFERSFGCEAPKMKVDIGSRDHQLVVGTVVGPIARSVDDLENLMEVLTMDQSHDRKVPPLGWSRNPKRVKRVGYFLSLPIFHPCLPAERAVMLSVRKLTSKGYSCVQMSKHFIDLLESAARYAFIAYCKDEVLTQVLKSTSGMFSSSIIGEPLDNILSTAQTVASTSKVMFKMAHYKDQNTRRGLMIEQKLKSDTYTNTALIEKFDEIFQIMRRHFLDHNIEAILQPGMPIPAVEHGLSNSLTLSAAYCYIWSALNFCGGVMPMTTVGSDECLYEEFNWNDQTTTDTASMMQRAQGLPLGVGVYGLPYTDEVVMDIMRDLEPDTKLEWDKKVEGGADATPAKVDAVDVDKAETEDKTIKSEAVAE